MPVDKDDVGIGWTVQTEAALPEGDSVPGQVFHVSQLPDPERQAVELGPQYPELYANVGGNLPVYESREEAEVQPGGPEPGDLDRAEGFRKPVEAARAKGQGDNQPEGVGNELSVTTPGPVDKNEGQVEQKEEKKEEVKSSSRSSKKEDSK